MKSKSSKMVVSQNCIYLWYLAKRRASFYGCSMIGGYFDNHCSERLIQIKRWGEGTFDNIITGGSPDFDGYCRREQADFSRRSWHCRRRKSDLNWVSSSCCSFSSPPPTHCSIHTLLHTARSTRKCVHIKHCILQIILHTAQSAFRTLYSLCCTQLIKCCTMHSA